MQCGQSALLLQKQFLCTAAALLVTSSLSTKMAGWVQMCSRSSGLMFITILIFAAGVLTAIDMTVAVVTDSEPFILSYLFSFFYSYLP
ncbi:MAG: hypothetical protein LBU81_06485 [Methanosarcinales archaeon]|jgi:hypothetical protein|nr:hypothetical protein [Methanosarcinales archaeon]